MKWIFSLITILLMGHDALAQAIFLPPSDDRRLRLPTQYTAQKILVDGRLDEAAWKTCSVAGDFTVSFPDQGKRPAYSTEVRVLYDSVNLYIGAICHYPGGKRQLQVQDMRRDFVTDNEMFDVLLEPFGDLSMPVLSFCVTPFGTQADIMCYQGGVVDADWDAVWRARCTIRDSVWTAEIAIPFSTLRYPAGSKAWHINFCRNERTTGEVSGWSPWPVAYDASHIEYAGLLTGIRPPQPKTNIRMEPYALVKNTGPTAGGEVKWALNTNTSLEGTVNTDFAQVDVDQQVINLTRSTVFFPEKRQFFKENANLFSVGQDGVLQPFFSRQIGLNDSGTAIPITGGLRLIHQSAAASAGFLMMRQGADSMDNPAWFNVARYRLNVGGGSQIGAMSVIRYNEPARGQPATWNPVGVVDGYWRIKQSMYLRGMVSGSTDNYAHTRGTAGMGEYNYSDNLVFADLLETYVSKGYSAQTGYMERTDFINTQPFFQVFLKPHWLPHCITYYDPQVIADIFHTSSTGQFQEASLSVSPLQLIFRDQAQIAAIVTTAWQNLDSVFAPVPEVTMNPGKYRYTRYELDASTNQAAHYSLQAKISTGGYYNGRLNSYFVALRVAPIPYISVLLNYTRNDFTGTGFAKTNATDHLLAPEVRLAWNPRIQLTAFYQYNTSSNLGALNLRFSWEYKPLSFVYFVFNSNRDIQPVPKVASLDEQSGILKISYIRQL